MKLGKAGLSVVAGSALVLSCVAAPGVAVAAPRSFANCTAMHRIYPHGVGRPNARDHTSGKPVTNFYRNLGLYNANTRLDRDTDGIACEAR